MTEVLFSIRLEKIRTKKEWTIEEMSKKSGIPYRTYQNYERGYREPPRWLQPIIIQFLEGLK